jgi:Alpha/beta hydrolase
VNGAEALPYPLDDPGLVVGAADRCARVAAVSVRVADGLAGDAALLAGAWAGPAARGCREEMHAATGLVRSLGDPAHRSAVLLRAHAEVLRHGRAQVDALRREYDALVAAQGRQLALPADPELPGPLRRLQAEETRDRLQLALSALHRRHQEVLDLVAEHARHTARQVYAAVASVLPGRADRTGRVGDQEVVLAAALPLLAASRRAAGVGGPPAVGTAPDLARLWWAGLTPDEQRRAVETWPDRVGALDGLPGVVRSAANERRLGQDVARLRAASALTDDERSWLDTCLLVQQQLAQVRSQRGHGLAPMTAQLLVFDPTAFGHQGRAAIAVGDVDTADNVAFLVPGMGSQVRGAMAQLTGAALRVTAETRRIAPGATTATVAWIGYDAPAFAAVVTDDAADHGADLLAADLLAVQASRDVAPHLSVIGHSYGSTTSGIALRDHLTGVDDLVLVGSPGPGVEAASDLHVPAGHVFVGASSRDPVSYLDWFGADPTHADFGAVRFEAEDVTRAAWHVALGDHSKYFDPHTESLANIAHVVAGDYAGVVRAPYRDEVFLLPDGINDDPESGREPTTFP